MDTNNDTNEEAADLATGLEVAVCIGLEKAGWEYDGRRTEDNLDPEWEEDPTFITYTRFGAKMTERVQLRYVDGSLTIVRLG